MSLSPMMQQYFDIKDNYRGYILMYRLGDFYEMFFDDAIVASKELELTLTGRDCGEEKRAPMCGVPFHKADLYIGKLVEKGFKVAICEQTEDPSAAKGLVKREVVRVVTPGTILENSLLTEGSSNYLCALYVDNAKNAGVAFVDISTGRLSVTEYDGDDAIEKCVNELGVYSPSEILVNCEKERIPEIDGYLDEKRKTICAFEEAPRFSNKDTHDICLECFGDDRTTALESHRCAFSCVGALFSYIVETQKSELSYIKDLDFYTD